ncbi:MAG TPA: hypothetical protein VHW66_01615 [Stellaceae bacterium]|nr:hypothetical protein [Stellaceae bacterium]
MRSRRPAKTGLAVTGSNLDGRDTALLEALWRGDELAAALRTAQTALAARERDLTRAEERIDELSDIVDAAQAAIAELNVRALDADAAARRDRELRNAVAAELFRLATGERKAAGGWRRSAAGENVPASTRPPLIWRWLGRLRRGRR